jgi:type II secretory pathway component PulM
MSGLFAGVRGWLAGRSVREQRMLAGMGAAIALFLGWFLIVAPLLAFREDAARDLMRAEADHALLSALSGRGGGAGGRTAPEVENVAAAAASAAGVTAAFTPGDDGTVRFAVSGAGTGPLFVWLAELERAGLVVRELGVTENADATLRAEGVLRG